MPFHGISRGNSTQNLYKQRTYRYIDDWELSETLYTTVNGNAIPIGSTPYSLGMQGTARLIPITGSQRPGVVSLNAGETNDGFCRLHTLASGAYDGGAGSMDYMRFEAVVAFSTLSTALEEYYAEIGIIGNAPGFGAYFRYDRANNGGVHKWSAVTENNGTETVVVLDGTTQGGVTTVNAGTITEVSYPSSGFFRLCVEIFGDGLGGAARAEFRVNDALCAVITSNMPTHSLAASVGITKTVGTTNRELILDYTDFMKRLRISREP